MSDRYQSKHPGMNPEPRSDSWTERKITRHYRRPSPEKPYCGIPWWLDPFNWVMGVWIFAVISLVFLP